MAAGQLKVVVTDYTFPDFSRYAEELAAVPCDLVVPEDEGNAAFLAVAQDADALLHEHLFLTREIVEKLTRCRVIAHHGKGVDNIAVPTATERGIVVANVLDASLDEVSEHVFALLFAVARRVNAYDRRVRGGTWHVASGVPVYRLRGRTLGLVGFGRIAQCVALRARAFGLRVIAYARRPDEELGPRLGVELVALDEVFERADVVSLHLPLTAQTERIASRDRLARMRPEAILINVSRGGLVDESALHAMLSGRRMFGAGLDVLAEEPPPADHPLLGLDNVVVTPHCAWYSEEGRDDVERRTAREAARVLSGCAPQSWVNPEVLPRFIERWGTLRTE